MSLFFNNVNWSLEKMKINDENYSYLVFFKFKSKLFIRNIVLFLSLLGFISSSYALDNNKISNDAPLSSLLQQPIAASSESYVPSAPDFDVKSYILIDINSGCILAEKNKDMRLPPASLNKVMSLYIAANELKMKKVNINDPVTISEKAWRTSGSRMFVKAGSIVPLGDLIKGIAIASGNDATVAVSEHIAGSEYSFVELMNQTAMYKLRMLNSHYADSSGLSYEGNYSTAADLANLASSWIINFPEYYNWFKEKWISYNNIKQLNRNRLLWLDNSVDGIKTGHTEEAGYCLIASALRNNTRLLVVIMGAKSDLIRTNSSMSLLNYGFRFFESRKIYRANHQIITPKVIYGSKNRIPLGLEKDLYISLPIGQYKKVKLNIIINGKLRAPIIKGQVCGKINVVLDNKIIVSKPLVALKNNAKAGFILYLLNNIKSLFNK